MKKLCEHCPNRENGKCKINYKPLPNTVAPYFEDLNDTYFAIKFPPRGKKVKQNMTGKIDILKRSRGNDTMYCWGGLHKIENLINALEFFNDLEKGE